MIVPTHPSRAWSWMGVLALAVAFVVWTDYQRVRRLEHVTSVGREDVPLAAASVTGYIDGTRQLIVPEHISASYQWISQTQQILARGTWRLRHIDYENAPFGRDVHAGSPYRWWLGSLAWADHVLSGKPLGFCVERAAIYSDPLLHLLLLVGTTVFVARRFGAVAASLCAVGIATLFPFAAGFLPGVPEDHVFILIFAIWAVLPLLAAARTQHASEPATGSLTLPFMIAGVIGGLGVWISVVNAVPVLCGIGVGALLAAWVCRGADASASAGARELAAWRAWAVAGAATVLAASLIELFPSQLADWELRAIHPLYGLAWLGGGELLARAAAWIRGAKLRWRWTDLVVIVLAAAAVAVVPVLMWKTKNTGFLVTNLLTFRLTKQADGVMAPDFSAWVVRDGINATAWATVAPLVVLVVALWMILRRRGDAMARASMALALGPVLVALPLAWMHLRWWQAVDGLLILLMIAAVCATCTATAARWRSWAWAGCGALVMILGVLQLVPKTDAAANVLTVPEVEGLVERDLAHWLVKHARTDREPVIFAPPTVTAALQYYGGLRGIGTLSWENKDGLSVALRIVISNSREEALALIEGRGITQIVLPSWDPFFEEYTRSASVQVGELFYNGLRNWVVPTWLRPIPYQLPAIGGFEQQSLTVFEVVDPQEDALGLSRITEYFIEMGRPEPAKASGAMLRRYPADFGALVARAQLDSALGDTAAFAATFDSLLQRLSSGADRNLPWDRRVSLAAVLARGQRMDLARAQAERCLASINEKHLRSLTTYSLYHLQVISKASGLRIADSKLRALALDLLPAELRARL